MRFAQIFLLSLVIFSLSCQESGKKDSIIISGKILNASGEKVVFGELDVESFHDLDSMTLDNMGFFRLSHNPVEGGFYVLRIVPAQNIILLVEKGEEVYVEADLAKQPFSYTVTGSPGSSILSGFFSQTGKNLAKADSLRTVLMGKRESPDFYQLSLSFDTLFMKILDDQKVMERDFIKQNPSSLASLIVINYKFGLTPVMNMEDDFRVYLDLDSTLSKKFPSNEHVIFHHKRVVEHQLLEKERQSRKK